MALMMMQLSLRQCHGTPPLHLHLQLLRFLALDANGERVEYARVRGSLACERALILLCATYHASCLLSCICEICVLVRYSCEIHFYGCVT